MEVIATEFFSSLKVVLKYGYIFFPALFVILFGISVIATVTSQDEECTYIEKVSKYSLFFEAFLVVANILVTLRG